MRKHVFDHIKLKHNTGIICLELVKKLELAGYRFAEFPVNHYHRTYGKSQFFNFKRLFKMGWSILKLWYELMIRRDTPLNI